MSYKSTREAYLAGKGKTEQLKGIKTTFDEMPITEPVAPLPITIPEVAPVIEPVKTKVPKKNKKK